MLNNDFWNEDAVKPVGTRAFHVERAVIVGRVPTVVTTRMPTVIEVPLTVLAQVQEVIHRSKPGGHHPVTAIKLLRELFPGELQLLEAKGIVDILWEEL